MDSLNDWLREKYEAYEHVQWLAENTGLYRTRTDSRLLEAMKKYGSNIYTYPLEALNAYEEIYKSIRGNPFAEMVERREKEEEFPLYPVKLDGYFIPLTFEEQQQALPIGFLMTAPDEFQKQVHACIKTSLKNWKKAYKEGSCSVVQRLKASEKKCDEIQKSYEEACPVSEKLLKKILFWEGASLVVCICIALAFFLIGKLQEYKVGLVLTVAAMAVLLIVAAQNVWHMAMAAIGLHNASNVKKVKAKKETLKEARENFEKIETRFFQEQYLTDEWRQGRELSVKHEWTELERITHAQNLKDITGLKIFSLPARNDYFEWYLNTPKRFLLLTALGLVLLLDWKGITGYILEHFPSDAQSEQKAELEEEQKETGPAFDENGFLFADSDSRSLTEDELYELREPGIEGFSFETLLGFARNEIYARHGYPFRQDGLFYQFYMQYPWYSEMEHKIIGDSELNEYEIENRDLIVEIETSEGIR